MSTMKKLESDFVKADLAAVNSLLAELTDEDVMMRIGLESRKQEIEARLHEMQDDPEETNASAALFFGGRPVIATRGIEADFGGFAAKQFQDLISKVHAQESVGLGLRGVVPNKSATTMHITNVVRGSFGFMFEEIATQGAVVDTSLKVAVDHATKLLTAFGDDSDEGFQEAVEGFDERVLDTARTFFRHVNEGGATLRLVSSGTDMSFGMEAIERAALRAESTKVEEAIENFSGRLWGVFPDAHQFEFNILSADAPIRGRVNKAIQSAELLRFNKDLVNVLANGEFKIKRVLRNREVVRQSYTLLSLTPVEESNLDS